MYRDLVYVPLLKMGFWSPSTAGLAVFACSGFLHAYPILVAGCPNAVRDAALVMAFFLIQGALVAVEGVLFHGDFTASGDRTGGGSGSANGSISGSRSSSCSSSSSSSSRSSSSSNICPDRRSAMYYVARKLWVLRTTNYESRNRNVVPSLEPRLSSKLELSSLNS